MITDRSIGVRQERLAFLRRVVSFIPFSPAGCTLRLLTQDLKEENEHRVSRALLDIPASLGVNLSSGRMADVDVSLRHGGCGIEKHWWVSSDNRSRANALAATAQVLKDEERDERRALKAAVTA